MTSSNHSDDMVWDTDVIPEEHAVVAMDPIEHEVMMNSTENSSIVPSLVVGSQASIDNLVAGEPNDSRYILRAIRVENFKSYVGVTVISPFPLDEACQPLVCVVGPNGSGKSNIMDAVAFCFSCADSAKLRGSGTASSLISNCSPNGEMPKCASVSVTLAAKDNQEDEIVFCRRISDSNDSKYSLNGKTVSLEKYRTSMAECGLDVKGNFLVFQGDVESLALADPIELGQIVDRVSGSGELRKTSDELQKRKNEKNAEFARLSMKKKKLLTDRKRVKNELAEIERIDQLIAKKKSANDTFFLSKLWLLDQCGEGGTRRSSAGGTNDARKTEKRLRTELAEGDAELTKLKSERGQHDMKQAKMGRKLVVEKEKSGRLQSEVASAQSKLTSVERRLEAASKLVSVKERDFAAATEKIVQFQLRSREVEAELNRDQAVLDDMLNRGVVDIDQQRDVNVVRPFFEQAGVQYTEEVQRKLNLFRSVELPLKTGDLLDVVSTTEKALSHAKDSMRVLTDRREEMSQQLVKTESTERGVTERIAGVKSNLNVKEKELKKLRKELSTSKREALVGKRTRLEEDKRKLIDELGEIRDSEQQIAKEQEFRDSLSAVSGQLGGRANVYGRVLDLVRPKEERFAIAVQTAIGKYMDAVLVKNVGVARDAVAFLKSTKRSPMTFIPVDDLFDHASSGRSHSPGGSACMRAIDCVESVGMEVVPGVTRGIEFVLSDTLVCESVSDARRIAYSGEYKGVTVVTLGGEKIGGNGTITVGSAAGGGRFGLRQVGEISSKIDACEKEYQAVLAELKQVEAADAVVIGKVRTVEMEIAAESAAIDQLKLEYERLHASVGSIASFLRENDGEQETAKGLVAMLEGRKQVELEAVAGRVVEVTRAWIAHLAGPTVRVPEDVVAGVAGSVNDPFGSAKSQFEEMKKQQKEKIAKLEQSIEMLKNEEKCFHHLLEEVGDVSTFRKEELALRRSLVAAESAVAQAIADLDRVEKAIADLSAQIEDSTNTKAELDTQLRARIAGNQELRDELRKLEAASQKALKEAEVVRTRKLAVLRDATFSSANIPLRLSEEDLAMGSVEEVSRQILESLFVSMTALVPFDSSSMDTGSADSMESIVEEILGKVNYDSVPTDIKRRVTTGRAPIDVITADLEKRYKETLAELESEIENTSGLIVNSSRREIAPEVQLGVIDAEIKEVSAEAELLRAEVNGVTTELKKITRERNEKFLNCFKYVSSKVDQLYKLLTTYEEGAIGTAAASLDLEVPVTASTDLSTAELFNSGVIFSLMPPFKRYTNIELLSGGEKTVAAVALLFSFLAFSSPPFSMVDEIDAALDAGNVTVLSKFMKHAVKHQLIVISLKELMYAQADCLIGVYKDSHSNGSGLVTLDLRGYSEVAPEEIEEEEVNDGPRKRLEGPLMTPGPISAPVTARRERRAMVGGA